GYQGMPSQADDSVADVPVIASPVAPEPSECLVFPTADDPSPGTMPTDTPTETVPPGETVTPDETQSAHDPGVVSDKPINNDSAGGEAAADVNDPGLVEPTGGDVEAALTGGETAGTTPTPAVPTLDETACGSVVPPSSIPSTSVPPTSVTPLPTAPPIPPTASTPTASAPVPAAPPALVAPAAPSAAGCEHPGQVLDLKNWKLTLPTAASGDKPQEITQPDLATYAGPPWFEVAPSCDAVAFRAAVDGATTSNSGYPRSELREMSEDGSTEASWSSTSGTHTLVVTEAFTKLPEGKPHLVGAQIHDSKDDVTVFRLEGSSLYITNGDDTHYKLVTSDYVLGTKFEAKFVVSGGQVQAYYNGALQATLPASFSGGYFKAGAYTQANCENAALCSSDNYGEMLIYSLSATHS
ncbi:MAG: polysaccharide lyase family 7 protein, partial [Mycobacteriales bacterium]